MFEIDVILEGVETVFDVSMVREDFSEYEDTIDWKSIHSMGL